MAEANPRVVILKTAPDVAERPDTDHLFGDGTLIDAALRAAARAALLRHKQAGVPIVIRRDGELVEIPPDQIEIPPE